MVPAPAQGKDLERTHRAFPGRLEHRHPALRIRRRADPAPGPVQGRPGPHQSPAHPGPGPRPGHRPDLHLAHRGQAGHPGHRRPAQRRPRPLPGPEPGLTGWTPQNLAAMLRNPKYTGYMVYGRHRTRNGRRIPVPPDQWLWSPAPVHPAIIDRDTWDVAQTVAAGHGSSRDGDDLNTHPATVRFYPYRGRVRCRDCQRRMAGNTYGNASSLSSYYRCPHNWASPKHAADHPDHPRTVQVPELLLDQVVGAFFATRIFGPERAALLAAQLPATDAAAAADRDAQDAASRPGSPGSRPRRTPRSWNWKNSPPTPADPATAGLPRPHPRPVRRTARRTRTPRSPAQDPGQDHTRRRRHHPAGPAPAGRGHPARPAAPAQGPAVPGLRHRRLVEQARQPGHRPRRDHRHHPARRRRHPRPRPRRLPRHRPRPARTHMGSGQHP